MYPEALDTGSGSFHFLISYFIKVHNQLQFQFFLINSFKNSQTGNGCNILIWLSVLTNQNNPNEETQIRHLDAIVFPSIEFFLSL